MKKGEISNKSLVVFLIVAMVISLGGTFISLSRLGRVGIPYVTGHASSDTGEVKIEIASLLSITLTDWYVDYGSCKPPNITGGKFYDSDGDNMYTSSGEPGKCTGNELKPQGSGDYLVVANDGNIEANITVMTDDNELINAPNTSLWFKTENASENPGCYGAHGWTNFTALGPEYPACNNLTHQLSPTRNAFQTAFRIWVPNNALAGSDSAVITYTGYAIP